MNVEHAHATPTLIAHGGAGGRGPATERPERRRGMMAAIAAGAEILRSGGSALDAVVATVRALEDHPLFNAGIGSLLTIDGTVEMDASVMVAERGFRTRRSGTSVAMRGGIPAGSQIELHAGASTRRHQLVRSLRFEVAGVVALVKLA